MKIKPIKKIMLTILITILLIFTATSVNAESTKNSNPINFDPLSDEIEVTVEIQMIRSFENFDRQILAYKKLPIFNLPDLYVKVFINGVEFKSDVWRNTKYVYDPQFSASLVVPPDQELVEIKIQLWDWNLGLNRLCDISDASDVGIRDSYDVELEYSIKTGHWNGDDRLNYGWYSDESGYGRLNGCDDGSMYQNERDCELYFDIYQTDPDGDKIPTWTELNVYGTDPEVNNSGEDADKDGVPIEWEHKWGHDFWEDWQTGEILYYWFYHPFEWNDHSNIDPDRDGIDNVEEYLTSQWGSDPFRKDLFVELDQMEAGPNGEPASILPEVSKELLRTAHNRQNVVYHLDDGTWEDSDSDMIPFDEETVATWDDDNDELDQIYNNYFLHGDENNWKRGIFHYGVIIYQSSIVNGNVFGPDRFQISSNGMEEKTRNPFFKRNVVYASAYMHECGHTLGIYHGNTPGCDDQEGRAPWEINWWRWRPYKSVMNYAYMYRMVDYSDGSRGRNDFDDWNRLDLTAFQEDWD